MFFFLYIYFGRPKKKETTLNLRANKADPLVTSKKIDHDQDHVKPIAKPVVQVMANPDSKEKHSSRAASSASPLNNASASASPKDTEPLATAKNLSVLFMYNGHDWEAHEVLGVPQGANMHMVTMAYQELIKKSDPSTFAFFEAAYKVISDKHKKHRL